MIYSPSKYFVKFPFQNEVKVQFCWKKFKFADKKKNRTGRYHFSGATFFGRPIDQTSRSGFGAALGLATKETRSNTINVWYFFQLKLMHSVVIT